MSTTTGSCARWVTTLAPAAFAAVFIAAVPAQAQTVTFTDVADAVPGRCYDAATTQPDPANPNRLVIGMNTGIVAGTFGTNAGCVATDDGSSSVMDTIAFVATAPDGFYVSRISFTQTLTTSGSRGGRGFAGSQWVVADDALPAGGAAVADLTGQNRTAVPVKITTFLAAAGGSVRSGSATASNASVLVELLPLVGAPPPPPPLPPRNPVPILTSLSPSPVTERGPAFTLTVNGTGFITGAAVRWNGQTRQTTTVSGSQLRAAIAAADIAAAGQAIVTVFNPPSGFYAPDDGGLSNELPLTINVAPPANPLPVVTSISPESVVLPGGSLTLTVNGQNFIPGSVVRFGGQNRTATFVSPAQLTTRLSLLDTSFEGTIGVTVFNPPTGFNPPPDGGESNSVPFRVVVAPPPPPPPPGEPPGSANGNVDDKRGKEWRQLTATRALSRFDVAVACPEFGPTPYACSGRIGTVDLSDWHWATSSHVIDLFSYFTGAISPATPSASGPEHDAAAAQFHGLFSLTQAAGGCTTYQGCFDFRSVSGVTASIDSTGGPVGGTVNRSQGFANGFFGSFGVGTITDDTSNGRGVYLWRPTGRGSGATHAYNDEGQSPSPYGGVAARVMNNDWVAGLAATPANAAIAITSPVTPGTDRVTVGADGVVQVTPGAPMGTYTFHYNLCATGSNACDDAQASVVVRSYALVAVNDQASATFGAGGSPLNVLTNDTLNGLRVDSSVVTLRQVSSTHPGVSINLATGAVLVAAGTPNAAQSLVYEVCEAANPANCRQANVTLLANTVDAVNDVFAKVSKSGGSTPSVLLNDRFNGGAATTANVQLSLVTALPAGITLDLATGRFVVTQTDSGDYPVTYQICEIASPTNCDRASLVLEVSGSGD